MDVDLSEYPKLTKEQCGHIRHFHNLVSQLDGDWHYMGTQEPLQEFLDAYRYQLATMAYATAATHFHRQPILRGVYKPLMRRIIHKMLLRVVWGYWFNTSLGGVFTNPDLKELRVPWADPVKRENIMYSGHLLLMLSLYAMLFDDDEFEKEGSVVFRWDPLFFGFGPEQFGYSTSSLQKVILDEMERNGWLGVCCEPNMVFVVCNQFPIIAMRLNDVRHGTHTADDVLTKYQEAWKKHGIAGEDGLFRDAWLQQQDMVLPATEPAWTAWGSTFMNSWNSSKVHAAYDQQALGFLTTVEGEGTRLQVPAVGTAIRKLVAEEKVSPNSASTISRAKAVGKNAPQSPIPYTKPMFGYIVQWLAELGKEAELSSLLYYADTHLNPKWLDGGLYYPRHDVPCDEDLNWTYMDPFSGNAAIGFARLEVVDGQKKMWEEPWTGSMVGGSAWVDGVGLGDGLDFVRGESGEEGEVMVLTMRSWDGTSKRVKPVFKNVVKGSWEVFVGGEKKEKVDVEQGGEIGVEVQVDGEDVDVVLVMRK